MIPSTRFFRRAATPLALAGSLLFLLSACGGGGDPANGDDRAEAAGSADAQAAPAAPKASDQSEAAPTSALQLETADEKASYALGYQLASRYAEDEFFSLDKKLMMRGVADAADGKPMAVSPADAQAAGEELQGRMQEAQAAAAAEAKAASEAYLKKNKEKEGVFVTDSGLQYEILKEGDSDESPGATDSVKVHYHGTLVDGTVFDSSVDRGRPISFRLDGVIPGWTEGLQLMSVGDKYRFTIPSDLAYGDQPKGNIPPGSTLIFEVELLGINE